MIKRITLTLLLATALIATSFLLFTGRASNLVKAAQCWEPGCCGYTLKYNQFTCQTNSRLCFNWESGDVPSWTCSTTGQSGFDNQGDCLDSCTGGSCSEICSGGFAKECVQTEGSVNCTDNSPSSCKGTIYAIQCQSLSGGKDCSTSTAPADVRDCWVGGAVDPSPDPSPSTDPGNCTGNWYGATGPSWCSNFNTQADCQAAGATQCQCGNCAVQVDRGKIAFTFFEDVNQNGVWDYNSGERRIHPNGSCNTTNTMVVPGVKLYLENNELGATCNIQNSEFSGSTCDMGPRDCDGDGDTECNYWGWEGQEYGDQCFTAPKTCSECHWSGNGSCSSYGETDGIVCGSNPALCSGGNANMRNGYVYVTTKSTGTKDIDVTLPSGWLMSPGSYGGNTSFTESVTTSYNRTRCNAGLKMIGLIPDYNKQCTVSVSSPTIEQGDSVTASSWAYSGAPGAEPARLVVAKSDYTQLLDASNQPFTPAGTIHASSSGRHYYIYKSPIQFENNSFNTGNFTGWEKGDGLDANVFNDGGDWTVQLQNWRMTYRHIATSWIDFGEDISGKTFKLTFSAKTHVNPDKFHQIYFDTNNGWNSDVWIGPPNMTWQKQTYSYTRTMPSNGYIDRLRIVFTGNDYNNDGDNSDDIPNQPFYLANVDIEEVVTPDVDLGGCMTGDATGCSSSTVISDLPAGDYKLHCDLPTDPQRCSGNPNCTYEGGSVTCSGWASCSSQDNTTLQVTAPLCGAPTPVSSLIPTGTRNMSTNPGNVPFTWQENSQPLTNYWTFITYAGAQKSAAQLTAIANSCATYGAGSGGIFCKIVAFSEFDTNFDGVLDATPGYPYNPEILKSNQLRAAVRATNYDCQVQLGYQEHSTWRDVPLNLVANVSGTLYEGDGNPGAGICSGPTGTPVALPALTTRQLSAASGGTPDSAQTASYSVLNVPYNPSTAWGTGTTLSLNLTNNDPSEAWACECPSPTNPGNPFTCSYSNIMSQQTGVNFWLERYDLTNGPWWQTVGGLVYGATGNIASQITQPCIDEYNAGGACVPFVDTQDLSGSNFSGGIVMAGSGDINSGALTGYVTDRTPLGSQQVAEGTYHTNLTYENYDFFVREILTSDYTNTVPSSVDEANDIFSTYSTVDPDDAAEIFYAPTSVTLDPTTTIELPAGITKAVVLINGNLTIRDSNDIGEIVNVDDGDFLAFIVNGTITVEASVGYTKDFTNSVPVTTDTNLEGVYVADTSLVIAGYDALGFPNTTDRKFIGAGVFVGLGGVSLDRDFLNASNPLTNAINNVDPVSTFVYRPDLVVNLPKFMKTPGLVWQEVN